MIAGMWWLKRQPEKFLREQLTDARDALTNQIAILEAGPLKPEPGEWAQMRAQAQALRDADDNSGAIMIVEQVNNSFSFRDRYWKTVQRQSGGGAGVGT